jgi:twitching motility protein PilT
MSGNIEQSSELSHFLDYALENNASDIHILAGSPPMVRIDGALRPIDVPPLTPDKSTSLIMGLIGQGMYEKMATTRAELDFSFSYKELRFRANAFFQRGQLQLSLRLLPNGVRDLGSLGMPPIVGQLIEHNQGLLLVTGPTGHGKSTTLAALVNMIATQRRDHIITIEDPIEYTYSQTKSIVSQREVGFDTPSFSSALRSALREDPDVVLVGEMRDQETMDAALQMAETGHLVLTSLHTNSASQASNRIVDIFPPHQQSQVRQQLSEVLLGIVSQRLLPRVQGGRVVAAEVLIANPAVRSIIREGKTHQLPNLIQTSAGEGMISLDKSLAELVKRGEVSIDDAMAWSLDPKALKMLIY